MQFVMPLYQMTHELGQ